MGRACGGWGGRDYNLTGIRSCINTMGHYGRELHTLRIVRFNIVRSRTNKDFDGKPRAPAE